VTFASSTAASLYVRATWLSSRPWNVLKVPHLVAVGFHLRVVAVRVLHDLIDHELGITTNIEVSDPEFDGDAQPVNEILALCYIVGGGEMESDHVAHVNSEG
jgi:hypothetical protein